MEYESKIVQFIVDYYLPLVEQSIPQNTAAASKLLPLNTNHVQLFSQLFMHNFVIKSALEDMYEIVFIVRNIEEFKNMCQSCTAIDFDLQLRAHLNMPIQVDDKVIERALTQRDKAKEPFKESTILKKIPSLISEYQNSEYFYENYPIKHILDVHPHLIQTAAESILEKSDDFTMLYDQNTQRLVIFSSLFKFNMAFSNYFTSFDFLLLHYWSQTAKSLVSQIDIWSSSSVIGVANNFVVEHRRRKRNQGSTSSLPPTTTMPSDVVDSPSPPPPNRKRAMSISSISSSSSSSNNEDAADDDDDKENNNNDIDTALTRASYREMQIM